MRNWAGSIAKVHFDALMENAPDVGVSSSDYVMAELHYGVWSPISLHDFQLGRMLNLDQVQRFSCFNERACLVLNATYNGPKNYAVQVFQQPTLWTDWQDRLFRALADNRAARLLEHFNLLYFFEKSNSNTIPVFDKLLDTQRKLSGVNYYEHSKGTRAFGWITALAIAKQNPTLPGCVTEASPNVKSIVKKLQGDHRVDVSFFSDQSIEVANDVLSDPQYEKICSDLVVCAVYVHYAYLIERAGYKKLNYDAFCKDVVWLREKHTDLASQLVDKIARYMLDELLSHVVYSNPKVSVRKMSADLASVPLSIDVISGSPVFDTALESSNAVIKKVLSVNANAQQSPFASPAADNSAGCEVIHQYGKIGAVADSHEKSNSIEKFDAAATEQLSNSGVRKGRDEDRTIANIGDEQTPPIESVNDGCTQSLFRSDSENQDFSQSSTVSKKIRRKFDATYKKDVLKKVRERLEEFQQVCKEENLALRKVIDWAKEFDPDLEKFLSSDFMLKSKKST